MTTEPLLEDVLAAIERAVKEPWRRYAVAYTVVQYARGWKMVSIPDEHTPDFQTLVFQTPNGVQWPAEENQPPNFLFDLNAAAQYIPTGWHLRLEMPAEAAWAIFGPHKISTVAVLTRVDDVGGRKLSPAQFRHASEYPGASITYAAMLAIFWDRSHGIVAGYKE